MIQSCVELAIKFRQIDPTDQVETLKLLLGNGFNVTYSPTHIQISVNPNTADFNQPLVRTANGLIFDRTGNVLCVPPPTLLRRFNMNQVKKNYANYTVTPIEDGTTVTVYYHNGWKLASQHSHDISKHLRFGSKTFGECFMELLDVTRLSSKGCYTFGFSHPDIHPTCTAAKYWFIQAVDLTDLNNSEPSLTYTKDLPFPKQQTIALSFAQFKAFCDNGSDSALGYVLNGDAGYVSNIIVESSKAKYLRNALYNIPRNFEYTPYKLNVYVTLRAYNSYDRSTFIKYLPQYKEAFSKYKKFYLYAAAHIENLLKQSPTTADADMTTVLSQLAEKVFSSLGSKIITTNHALKPIIIDLIMADDCFDIVFDYFQSL